MIIFHLHKDLTMKYSLKGVAGQGRVYKNGRGNIHARHFFWRSHTFAHIVISFKLLFFRIQMFWIIVVFIHKKTENFPHKSSKHFQTAVMQRHNLTHFGIGCIH